VDTAPPFTRNELDPRTGVDIRTAVEIITHHSNLTNATKALYWTGLVNELCLFDCNNTVFAPTDAAFATSNANVAKIWTPPWIMHLKGMVKNHITEQRIESRDLTIGRTMAMLSGETVSVVNVDDGAIALMSAGTNVSYVTQTDYEADNGVVHLVDALLWPSFMEMDLFGLANTDLGREYSILLELVYRLNLNTLLSTVQDVTIFAPTNAAFEALGKKKLSSLRSDNNYLQEVLSNHLVLSVIPSMGIPAGGQSYPTLSGQDAHLSNGTLMVNDANVLIADALANNGIVHVIDKVLLEPYSPITNTVAESREFRGDILGRFGRLRH
jgi:transforming growth factor-beta-induced protein